MSQTSISDHLIAWAHLDSEQVAKAEQIRSKFRVDFLRGALEAEVISDEQFTDFLCERLSLPSVDPSGFAIQDRYLNLVPADTMLKYQVVCFYAQGKQLFLATSEPEDFLAIDDIRFMTGMDVIIHVASPASIKTTLQAMPSKEEPEEDFGGLEDALSDMDDDEMELASDMEDDETSSIDPEKAATQAPVVKMVNLIIMDAIRRKTSDIHIEPFEKSFRVRFRMDGMLKEVMKPPMRLKSAIISRLKIMSHLNIAEKRLPQDGRIKVRTPSGKEVEFRVSILPTLFGEKVVMRLLDKSALKVDMTQLGFEQQSLDKVKDAISRPYGMFLVTGPTGSGKTTTLYSAIMELNDEGVNISTAEDPVEFSVEGINQVHVIESIGLTFASTLRSFLRQDPDIILVGEIRDLETAEIAIKAALTGHLVLSTLHTNDAPSTLTRLLNMGVDGFLVASSMNAIVAQRLIRKLCPFCKQAVEKDEQMLLNMGMDPEMVERAEVHGPVGCGECHNTGYKGRAGLYEVLTMTDEMQEILLKGANVLEIRELAIKQGMLTMRQSGMVKIASGLTSVAEVMRVTV